VKQIRTFVLLTGLLLAPQFLHAQPTTYVSNLGQPVTGTATAGIDYLLAAEFATGLNPQGYYLTSVQLGLAPASGNPNNFAVDIFVGGSSGGMGHSIATLYGPTDPAAGGVFTYTPVAPVLLIPNYFFYVVLSSATPVATGSYNWNLSAPGSFTLNEGWRAVGGYLSSVSGATWTATSGFNPQFAVNATPIPEPGVPALFVLGGLVLWRGCSSSFNRRPVPHTTSIASP
jgi:hypothetical protein